MESQDFPSAELTARDSTAKNSSPNPSGRRKQRPELDWVRSAADSFTGLPNGMHPREAVFLLKRPGVAASAGLLRNRDSAIALLDFWLSFSRESDWRAGSRPLVWTSVAKTAEKLDWCPRKVRDCENALRQIGAYVPRDSANLHRQGERDADGRIILDKTYGQDLAPLVFLIPKLREFDAEIAKAQEACARSAKALSAETSNARTGIRQGLWSGMLTLEEGDALQARLPGRQRPAGKTSLEALHARVEDIEERRRQVRAVEHELQQLRAERMLFDPDAWPCYADAVRPPHAPFENPVTASAPADPDAKTCSLGCESLQRPIEYYSESVGLYLQAQSADLRGQAAKAEPTSQTPAQASPPASPEIAGQPAAPSLAESLAGNPAEPPEALHDENSSPPPTAPHEAVAQDPAAAAPPAPAADEAKEQLPDPKDRDAAWAWWQAEKAFSRKWHVGKAAQRYWLGTDYWGPNDAQGPDCKFVRAAWAVYCSIERDRAERRHADVPVLDDAGELTWAKFTPALPRAIHAQLPKQTPLVRDPGILIQAARDSLKALRLRPEDWDKACSIMGAPKTALCVTAMAAKQETDQPIRAPGRYLAEMSRRDQLGELNLAQTLQAIVRRCELSDARRSAFRRERHHA